MKKIILSALMISSLGVFAQEGGIKRGAIAVGGGIGIQIGSSSVKSAGISADGPSTFGLNLLPNVQYFVTDKISIGLQVGVGSKSTTTKTPTTATTFTETVNADFQFSIAPYARYYMMMDNGKVGFFGQGAFGLTAISGTTKVNGVSVDKPTTSVIGLGVSPGIIFFPGKRIGIEAVVGNLIALQLSSTTTKTTNATGTIETVSSSTSLDFLNVNTMGFTLGFNYYFGN